MLRWKNKTISTLERPLAANAILSSLRIAVSRTLNQTFQNVKSQATPQIDTTKEIKVFTVKQKPQTKLLITQRGVSYRFEMQYLPISLPWLYYEQRHDRVMHAALRNIDHIISRQKLAAINTWQRRGTEVMVTRQGPALARRQRTMVRASARSTSATIGNFGIRTLRDAFQRIA